jgi:hypothetical protein
LRSAAVLFLVALQPPNGPAVAPVDPRSVELVRERCAGGLATRDLTLFLNGTIRLREGAPGQEKIMLRELGHAEVDRLIGDFGEIDLSETESATNAPQGAWTERCSLTLSLPAREPRTLEYARLDTGTLNLDRLRRIVEFLVDQARLGAVSADFPPGYKPAVGDVVERDDGLVFAIVAFTSDGRGVELSGTETPLTLYVQRDELPRTFRRLLRRAAP